MNSFCPNHFELSWVMGLPPVIIRFLNWDFPWNKPTIFGDPCGYQAKAPRALIIGFLKLIHPQGSCQTLVLTRWRRWSKLVKPMILKKLGIYAKTHGFFFISYHIIYIYMYVMYIYTYIRVQSIYIWYIYINMTILMQSDWIARRAWTAKHDWCIAPKKSCMLRSGWTRWDLLLQLSVWQKQPDWSPDWSRVNKVVLFNLFNQNSNMSNLM